MASLRSPAAAPMVSSKAAGLVSSEAAGTAILIFVTLLWGSTFVVIKHTVASVPVPVLLAARFTLALALIAWIRPKRSALLPGLALGCLMFAGYASQTLGLAFTSASNAAFITGLSVILTPALAGVFFGQRLSLHAYLAALAAMVGIALLTLPGMDVAGGLNVGDLLVFGTAIALALHTICLGRVAGRHSPLALTAVQLWSVALLSWCWVLPDPSSLAQIDARGALGIAYLAVVGVVSLGLQALAQRVVPAHRAAVVFGLEPVFGAMFAFVLLQEMIGVSGWLGGALVVAGMMIGSGRRATSS